MEQVRKMVTDTDEAANKESRFGVTLFGFNKKEVSDYIKAADADFKTAVGSYESKLNEQSTTLAMALREKEKLALEVEELRERVRVLSADVNEQKCELAAENNILKARIEGFSEIESKNKILCEESNKLKSRCEYIENGKAALLESIKEKDNIILEQCRKYTEIEKTLKLDIEQVRADFDSRAQMYELRIQTATDGLKKTLNVLDKGLN